MNRSYGRHSFVLTVVALGISLPALADPPPWAPAHGRRGQQAQQYQEREYQYVYYPAQQVYYSPEQQLWFWMNGGAWQFGVSLPAQYHIQSTTGITLMLDASRPYVQHTYVEEQYGRPWREQQQRTDRHDAHQRQDKHQKHRGHD
jgi:hypothetical protein